MIPGKLVVKDREEKMAFFAQHLCVYAEQNLKFRAVKKNQNTVLYCRDDVFYHARALVSMLLTTFVVMEY